VDTGSERERSITAVGGANERHQSSRAPVITLGSAGDNYIEPTVTDDLDILVSFRETVDRPKSGLITLSPLFAYLNAKGYQEHRKEGLVIEGWPVRFLPVASDLDAQALAQAQEVEIQINEAEGAVWTRILRAEHLVAICLRVGRPRDLIRITQFLEEDAVDLSALSEVLRRHHLNDAWQAFCNRTGIADPCHIQREP
jgi:hypothetical protein